MARKKVRVKKKTTTTASPKKQKTTGKNKHIFGYGLLILIIIGLSVLLVLEKNQHSGNTYSQLPNNKPTDSSQRNQVLNYKTDFEDTWQKLTTQIDRVTITSFGTPKKDITGQEYEGTLEVSFSVSNQSEYTITPNLSRATLLIEGQKVDPSSSPSSYELGGELGAGQDKEGIVTYYIPKLSDPKAIKSINIDWTVYNFETKDVNLIEKNYHEEITLEK